MNRYGAPPRGTHSMPAGRRPLGMTTDTITSGTTLVKPGHQEDGQSREGTRPEYVHHGAKDSQYDSPAQRAHQAALRGNERGENASVHSKGVSNGAEQAKSDPRNMQGKLYSADVPGALPAHSNNQKAAPHQETVGWVNGKFQPATHPNANRHAHGLDSHLGAQKSAPPSALNDGPITRRR
jgi:hypothetical protein